jgi:hypothetical protein
MYYYQLKYLKYKTKYFNNKKSLLGGGMITFICTTISGNVHEIMIDDVCTIQELFVKLGSCPQYEGKYVNIIYNNINYNLDNITDSSAPINSIFNGKEIYNIEVILETPFDITNINNIEELIEYGNWIGKKFKLYDNFCNKLSKYTSNYRNKLELDKLRNLSNKELILYILKQILRGEYMVYLYISLNDDMKADYDITYKFLIRVNNSRTASHCFSEFIQHMPDIFQTDEDFIIKVIETVPFYIKFVKQEIKDKQNFIDRAIAANPEITNYISS